MMFCFRGILQMSIILIGFPNTNDFVNIGNCKFEIKFTCHNYYRLTSSSCMMTEKIQKWIMDIEKFLTYIELNRETFLRQLV